MNSAEKTKYYYKNEIVFKELLCLLLLYSRKYINKKQFNIINLMQNPSSQAYKFNTYPSYLMQAEPGANIVSILPAITGSMSTLCPHFQLKRRPTPFPVKLCCQHVYIFLFLPLSR